jgi:hypothetical protein
MYGVAILDMVVGLVFLGFCIPLVQRRIGRNGFYGFRTPRTLASDKAWYAVNHGAGKVGVYISVGMVIVRTTSLRISGLSLVRRSLGAVICEEGDGADCGHMTTVGEGGLQASDV